jgi:hypothetical protein
LVFDPGTGRFQQKVTLQNTGAMTLSGPLTVRLDGLGPQARLQRIKRGASRWLGLARHEHSFDLGNTGLAPGASLIVTLEFTTPSRHHLHFAPHVLIGVL